MKPLILYDSRLADGTPSETGAVNVTDWRPYTTWTPPSLPATITWIGATTKTADYGLILYHNLASCGCTVEFQGSDDGFSTNTVLASATPTDDLHAVLKTFTQASFKDWRIYITGTTPPTIAIATLGNKLELPRNVQDGYDPLGRVPRDVSGSQDGHALGRLVLYEVFSETVTLNYVEPTWLRTHWDPAWRTHLRSAPFGFAWNPDDHPEETLMVISDGKFDSKHSSLHAQLAFKISGVIS